MPIYQYKCLECNTIKEIERSIHSEASTPICDECIQLMSRVWTDTAVAFKGDGWGGDYGQKR